MAGSPTWENHPAQASSSACALVTPAATRCSSSACSARVSLHCAIGSQQISNRSALSKLEGNIEINTSDSIAACVPPKSDSIATSVSASDSVATNVASASDSVATSVQPPFVRILQLNADRSIAVAGEISQLITEKRLDILLLQEPYVRQQGNSWSVSGLGSGVRVAATTRATPWAAIAICNPNFHILYISQLSNPHCAVAEVQARDFSFFVISHYFQYKDETQTHLDHLEKVLSCLQGKRVLIGADTNATSLLWGNSTEPPKGELLEDFIESFSLQVINDKTQGPTFETTKGTSFIDVTLASRSINQFIRGWNLRKEWTISGHHAIEIRLGKNASANKQRRVDAEGTSEPNPMRFNTKKADWDLFDEVLEAEAHSRLINLRPESIEEIESMVEALVSVVTKVCVEAMPRKVRNAKANKWWSKKLKKKKQQTFRRRVQFKHENEPEAKAQMKRRFLRALNNYKRLIKETKARSWKKTTTTEGNKNPWGPFYKAAADKIKPINVISTLKTARGATMNMKETAHQLLNTHIVDDKPEEETAEQQAVRAHAENIEPETENATPFTIREIASAIKTMKNGKAPGLDLIEVEVLKRAVKNIPSVFTTLYNACLQKGHFPKMWKRANLITFLKGADKDPNIPKSYRPICLLSVVGKVFERLLKYRIERTCFSIEKFSNRQYGFMQGKSCEDAINEVRRLVDASEAQYTIGLLYDISGAFDNVWWPKVYQALADHDCPKNVFKVMKSFFADRYIQMQAGDKFIIKQASRGCPQGAPTSSTLWILTFNPLLKRREENSGEGVAFADDYIEIIKGNSRKELEKKGNEACSDINEWCKSVKLQLSKEKTIGIMLKNTWVRKAPTGRRGGARPDRKRKQDKKATLHSHPPRIHLDDALIKFVKRARYLGIHFDENLAVHAHVEHIQTKSAKLFGKLKRISKKDWGLNFKTLRTIYRGVFESVATYAASSWVDRCNEHDRRKLRAAQRNALITVTGAYRTASLESLCMIAGVLPIELLLEQRIARYQIRVGKPATANEQIIEPDTEKPVKRIIAEIRNKWQVQINNSSEARTTYSFINDIDHRLDKKRVRWMVSDHYTTQILTGHGQFQAYRQIRGFVESASCKCGAASDDVKHFLLECPLFDAQRVCINEYTSELEWPEAAQCLIADKRALKALTDFSHECLWIKEEEERNRILNEDV